MLADIAADAETLAEFTAITRRVERASDRPHEKLQSDVASSTQSTGTPGLLQFLLTRDD
jgi:hypothetical protein